MLGTRRASATPAFCSARSILLKVQATQTRGLRSWYYGFYIQDEFRVSSKLTLNYGLRYEVQPQYTNPNDNASEFDPTVPNSKAGGLLGALTFWVTGLDATANGDLVISTK